MFGVGITELGILVVIVLIYCAPILLLALLLRWALGGSRRSRMQEQDETRITQEIHAGLARLEQRVEALETLLLDTRKDTTTK